ncbi:MAG: hypothetical protein IPH64_19685 [Comamonadaceae bacterium]|nr:hypothetical protein [Comamonadaceae bacterium]
MVIHLSAALPTMGARRQPVRCLHLASCRKLTSLFIALHHHPTLGCCRKTFKLLSRDRPLTAAAPQRRARCKFAAQFDVMLALLWKDQPGGSLQLGKQPETLLALGTGIEPFTWET